MESGWCCNQSRGTVRRLMRQEGLVACQPRPKARTTVPAADLAGRPDLIERNFTADAPARKLVGDITYIHTREGFVYLATVTGLLLEKNCWLRHGGTHANRIGPKRSGNGSEELLTRQGCDDFSFGSGIAVHVRRLHRHHEQVWPPRIGRKNRRVLRQRSSRYHSTPPAQERTRQPVGYTTPEEKQSKR